MRSAAPGKRTNSERWTASQAIAPGFAGSCQSATGPAPKFTASSVRGLVAPSAASGAVRSQSARKPLMPAHSAASMTSWSVPPGAGAGAAGTGTSGTNGGHQPVLSSAAWRVATQPKRNAANGRRVNRDG